VCPLDLTIKDYFGSLPRVHRFMPHLLDLISTSDDYEFTSGLYPESTDSCHLFSGSEFRSTFRTIRRSTFTLGLFPKSTDSCHLSSGSDGSDLLQMIRWSTFTLGLCMESTDSRHLSSRSDGPDLLQPFGALRFDTSALRCFCFRLWEFQLSI
jgi:hypothetical protein